MSASSWSINTVMKRALIALGVVAVVLGIAAATVLEDPLVYILPSTWVVVVAAGGIAFILGLWAARTRYRGGVRQTEVRDVELPLATPAPGDDVDSMLYRLTNLRQGTIQYRDQIQERLAEAAIAVIRQRENCSREAAAQELRDGSWTENELAAAFFTGGGGPQESLGEKIFGAERTPYERWVRVTVAAIAQRAELASVEMPDPDEQRDDEQSFFDRLLGSGSSDLTQQANKIDEVGHKDATRVDDDTLYYDLLPTGHWRGVSAFALVAAGWGVVSFTPELLLASVVGIGLAAFARAGSEPPLTALEVDRTVSDDTPLPGDEIQVSVTVENTSDTFMSDLRLIDEVPEGWRVTRGSPRMATALRPGGSATITYEAIAERGTHEWPLLAIGRNLSGSYERQAVIETDGEVNCVPTLRTISEMDVRSQTSLYSGQVDTAEGGSGLEFFAVREYVQGDPMNRIDWKRHARTGELATIDFRQERAAQIVLLFDARSSAYVSPGPGDRHALDRSVDAATEIFAALADGGNLVGLAAYDTVPCWVGPSAGDAHEERARRTFASHPALSSIPPEAADMEGHYVDPMVHVRRQLSPEAQIMLFSPLTDDYTAEVARRLDSAGHLVTIVSPDPTVDRTVGQQLARVERKMRVASLREHGIRVVDWDYDEPLGLDLERAQQRWSV